MKDRILALKTFMYGSSELAEDISKNKRLAGLWVCVQYLSAAMVCAHIHSIGFLCALWAIIALAILSASTRDKIIAKKIEAFYVDSFQFFF